jgi:transcription elongation factor GreA
MKKYFTKKKIEELKKELEDLETKGRRRVAERLKHAASFGDLSENADFEDAKEEQRMLETKILELKKTLKDAVLIKEETKKDKVYIGSTVVVESKNGKDEFEIVGAGEADPLKGKISCESPLGKLLIGKKKGAKINLETPSGEVSYKILEIK